VVKYSLIPAEKLNADRSFIEIAVLLHDYASIKDSNPCRDHQVDGAVEEDRILSEMGFPKKRLNRSEIAFDRTGAV